jgi:hypothetical protein
MSSPPTAATAPNLVHPPPDITFPSPPRGFVPPDPYDFLGFRPTSREVASASTIVGELTRASDFQTTFGSTAPTAESILDVLQLALAWRLMRDRTAAWTEYVKAQDAMAWKSAATLLASFRPAFLAAATRDTALKMTYRGLAEMFEAPKLVANQGITTRRKNAKARKAAQEAEAAATAQTAAPAPAEPAAATPVEAPVATRTVTITG